MLEKLKVNTVRVKKPADLEKVHGLIIPGGESTVIGMLMKKYGLDKAIKKLALQKKHPLCVWGTCAGAILIAKKVYNRVPDHLKLMNIAIERNAYGRQLDSFRTSIAVPRLGKAPLTAVFIRAPKVRGLSKNIQILADCNGSPVMLRENNFFATMFHPELTSDTRVHKYFIDLTSEYAA